MGYEAGVGVGGYRSSAAVFLFILLVQLFLVLFFVN